MDAGEFIFRADLTRFWQLVFAQWQDLHKVYGCQPFSLTATNLDRSPYYGYLPSQDDRILLSFGSDLYSGPFSEVVDVEAAALLHAPRVRLRVYISFSIPDAPRLDAIAKWHRIYATFDEQGWVAPSSGWHLQDMPEPLRTKASQPAKGAPLDVWFDWYHRVQQVGPKVTLKDIARKTSYNPDHVRQMHGRYKKRVSQTPDQSQNDSH